jgi:hypothetical protein
MSAAAFREVLEQGDFRRLRQLHASVMPHLPAPKSDEEAEVALHMARTQAAWMGDRPRCYSHAWLIERSLPSQLPDELKPTAERLYPRIVDAVFISANTNSPLLKPVAKLAQAAMSDAVEDCYANGDKDPAIVRAQMEDARKRTFSTLLGVE